MTYSSHVKTINISRLKSHLSETLRSVKHGERIEVLDRDTPVAQVIPMNGEETLILSSPSGQMRYPRPAHPVGKDPLFFYWLTGQRVDPVSDVDSDFHAD
jgi:antitoxin (DNA-binding transcriptional repressor) of toxin-antitoxin stability system